MNLADDFGSSPEDLTNLNWEMDWGPMANDIRHRFTLGGVFSLPAGVQFASAVQANTGKPYNPVAGYGGGRAGIRAINPATGQPFGRNSFRGPGFATWDMRVAKSFNLQGSRALEVSFDVFNVTDRVNLNGDSRTGFNAVWGTGTQASPSFGTASNIVLNSQRQAQFGARFRF